MSPEQIQQIETTVSSICKTVHVLKGSKKQDQLKADVNAKVGGIFKIIPLDVNVGGEGSVSHETHEGLSQNALDAAIEREGGCRERVFNRMFDWITSELTRAAEAKRVAEAKRAAEAKPDVRPPAATTPPPVTRSMECVVTNPSGRPMNVRETPNGVIKSIVRNGAHIKSLRLASAANDKPWAYVADQSGREIGWVFFPYLTCSDPGIR